MVVSERVRQHRDVVSSITHHAIDHAPAAKRERHGAPGFAKATRNAQADPVGGENLSCLGEDIGIALRLDARRGLGQQLIGIGPWVHDQPFVTWVAQVTFPEGISHRQYVHTAWVTQRNAQMLSTESHLSTDLLDSVPTPHVEKHSQANARKHIYSLTTATPRPRSYSKEHAVSLTAPAPVLPHATPYGHLSEYDSALDHRLHAASPGPCADQMALPLTWEVAPGIPAVPPAPRHLRLVGKIDEPAPGDPAAEVPAASWVARMARAVAEVGSGDRPAGQLTRWVERRQLQKLAARGAAFAHHPSTRAARPTVSATRGIQQVRAIRICPVSPGIVETSAVLVGSGRGRAVAMRFEFVAERWLMTAFSLG